MISTHVLDTSSGEPASEVLVTLEKRDGDVWSQVNQLKTNRDGRIDFALKPEAGVYRLMFHIDEYFKRSRRGTFFLEAPVVFRVEDITRKYHVPLLLNPYGYSTYRGS